MVKTGFALWYIRIMYGDVSFILREAEAMVYLFTKTFFFNCEAGESLLDYMQLMSNNRLIRLIEEYNHVIWKNS